jgi:signal transduction histidine kinase
VRAPEQLHVLETLANQLAAAMERAILAEESRRIHELEEMDRLKSEFVAVASNELKAPIRSIARTVERLRPASPSPQRSPDEQHLLHEAAEAVDRLERLVDDLLDLSRVEAGRLELDVRPSSPHHLAERALERIGAAAEQRGTSLSSDVPEELPEVLADPQRIESVIVSLLDNALRYASDQGHVMISADQVGRYVQFSVADDGPGVPVEDQARIFDRFVRLPGARGSGGLGLGLAVAREIVRGHRGAIWVDSGPGPGSVFSFTLPVADITRSRSE